MYRPDRVEVVERLAEEKLTPAIVFIFSRVGCEQAVRLFRENQREVGVLLLDVQPDGPAALAAVRAIDPTVPAVFMTGNPGNYSAEDLLAMGAAKVLPKPFRSLPELAQILRRLARPE